MRFREQVVVVSGATSGIGRAIAEAFAAAGAQVIALGRDQARLQEVAAQVDLALTCDVTDDRQVAVAIDAVLARHGRIDVLVNNAGIGLFEDVLDTSMAQLELVFAVNLFGVARLTRAALPAMVEAGSGAVVNIASVAGRRAYARHSAYCASKHALIGWSEALRLDLLQTGVDVVVICPPAVDTPFFDNAGHPTFHEDHEGLELMSAEEVARQTLDATLKRERSRTLGTRAKALYAASLVAPAGLDALRRLTGKLKPRS